MGKIVCVLLAVFLLCGCNGKEAQPKTYEQELCEHHWASIGWGITYVNIYCPACELEQKVTQKEWNKIRADMAYSDYAG